MRACSKPIRSVSFPALRAFLALAIAAAPAAWPAPAAHGLPDRARIHADYEAGDFDKVIRSAEAHLASGLRFPRTDSVFLVKHLAVVYAAHPSTRERGRYHMLRMLDLDPSADLLDMFVGEEVDGIFEKVRRESALKRASVEARPASKSVSKNASKSASKSAASSEKKGWTKPASDPARAFVPAPAARLKPWNLANPVRPKASARTGGGRAGAFTAAATSPTTAPATAAPATAAPATAAPAAVSLAATIPASSLPVSAVATPYREFRPKPAVSAALKPAVAAALLAPSPSAPAAGDAPASDLPRTAARWKEPAFWVGGGAAIAVLGLTVFYGSQEWDQASTRSRTYGVPAQPTP